ncbi:MAG: recombination-associated protein RdgC [Cellvibrionales bacterium]|nr:recombination-associated protein RdgC [Cellvibrionales bacterium]
MWFKNVVAFTFTQDAKAQIPIWESAFAEHPFSPLSSQQQQTIGFIPPVASQPETLLYLVHDFAVFAIKQEEKILPAAVINEQLSQKVADIELKEGRKVTRKERLDLKDEIIFELTPKAFSKSKIFWGLVSLKDNLLLLNCSSASASDKLIDCIREATTTLPILPVTSKQIPTQLMTSWLKNTKAPAHFQIGESTVLKSLSEQGAAIRFKQCDLFAQDIPSHLEKGFSVNELSLIYKEKLQCTVDEKLFIKQIKLTDSYQDSLDQEEIEDDVAHFEHSVTFMGLELLDLLKGIKQAFTTES